MKHSILKKLAVGLLTVVMVASLIPASVLGIVAEGVASGLRSSNADPVYILAGSDFQPTDGNVATGVTLMSAILEEIEGAGYTSFDGFLFAGDYNISYDEAGCIAGRDAVESTVQSYFGTDMHEVYVKGNHDPDAMIGRDLPASGANDPASGDYGVFVIHEKDYMWFNDEQATIQKTAAALDAYLDEKYVTGFDQPIFVVSHLPLHYSLRTQVGGDDGKYAKYIFDVLQEAGEKGLNVFFLYGHDHSHGWDDYIGGAAVYLTEGDSINIAKEGNKNEYTAETLKFTYMNAGFVSYYYSDNPGACTELTMTVFKIENGEVQVERYNADGKTNLKASGVLNITHHVGAENACCSHQGTEAYPADTRVCLEDTFTLRDLSESATKTDGAVSVTAPGLTGVTVEEGTPATDDAIYTVTYDIRATTAGGSLAGDALVEITLPDAFKSATKNRLSVTNNGAPCTVMDWTDGVLTLLVEDPSTVTVAYKTVLSTAKTYYERIFSESDIVDGSYLIIFADQNKYVKTVLAADEADARHGFDVIDSGLADMPAEVIEGKKSAAMEWVITSEGDRRFIGKTTQKAEFYVDETRVGLRFADSGTSFSIVGDEGVFTIGAAFNNATYYWQYNVTGDLINGYASSPSAFYLYKKVINEPAPETTTPESETTIEPETTVEPETTTPDGETTALVTTAGTETTIEPGTTVEPTVPAETTAGDVTTTAPEDKGCGSVLGAGATLAALAVAAGALALRKKREE